MQDDFTHKHHHDHGHASRLESLDEAVALLEYTVAHNEEHARQLDDLAALIKGDAATLIAEAQVSYRAGNHKLKAALEAAKKPLSHFEG